MRLIFQKILLLTFITFLFLSQACRKDNSSMTSQDSVIAINSSIYSTMKDWYLWYDKIPQVDPKAFSSAQEFLDSITYKPIDRWSFVMSLQEYNDYFLQGKMYGHGFSFSLDAENHFRIAFVFQNSDLYKSGVRRGWIIEKINGIVPDTSNIYGLLGKSEIGIQNTFLFKKPDSTEISETFTKKEVIMNMVLFRDTLQVDNKIVGYLVFDAFLADAETELNEAFDFFIKTGVTELVLDLRYNGGGELAIAQYLAGIIGGNLANNSPFAKLTCNNKHQDSNLTFNITKNARTLNLTRLFTITTNGTASASEDLINGLKPYMNVYLIGSKTDGKPTGMFVFQSTRFKFVLIPVTYEVTNKDNFGDFFNGLQVDKQEIDDIYHDFGDRNEACLQQALYYIKYGAFGSSVKDFYVPYKHHKRGWKTEIDAY